MSDTKIAATPDLLTVSKTYVKLPADKRQQFRRQLRERGIRPHKLPIVPFPERGPACPLSHAQERMWFLWRLDPSSAAYNITGAVRLQGVLERRAVKIALERIVARHESLRKHFTEHDGVPMQVTGPTDYGWRELDAEPDASLAALLERLTSEPFDLERGPLLRVALVRTAADDHVLHVAMHHIVSDGLSIDVFVDEFVTAYRIACGVSTDSVEHHGKNDATDVAADAPDIQYGDYATWQREWLDDESLAGQLDYWRKELGGEQPILELPLARTRTGMRSPAGGSVSRSVAPHVVNALRQLSLAGDCTLFMTLLAAYDVLLSRYSGQDDIRVGVPVSGRDRDETERLIGFFVNTLVIRAQMDGVSRFADLLAQVRTRTLDAYARQDVPFARLVQELQPQRSFGHTPLFQTMFNYLGADRGPIRLPGLTVSNITADLQTSRFDLVLSAREQGDGLEVSFTYARDVLDGSTVSRMLDHYVSLLEQVGARGEVHLGELVLKEESPRAALAAHGFEPVGERIATRALQQPQAPAVHCEGARLNYGELQTWSGRLAQALRTRGVSAETRVGLCVTRGPGLVAALVGVLRSGGAFVPLDPAYPAERLATMLDDAQVSCVLADATTLASCGELFAGREVIDIGTVEAEDETLPEIVIHPEQLAYVIYTSGSTGRPKGVAVSHVALSRHLDDFIGTYGISGADTQLQSSTVNFDVALHELLPALVQGGQVEMRGPQLWDIETTSRHLKEGGVTFARIPTAYWQQWLRTPPARADLAALRQITVGGEALPGDALAQWQRGPLAHIQLDNLYGPTETTVACMYRRTDAADAQQTVVSIGGPYGSRCVYVLDRFGNEVPVGGLGELCIGGLTLARGYLARPGLSADRFVPDPNVPGARLYRSGDLCRRRADGSIDFLGRLDQQVKLRGFRIELGEIEAALRQVEGVSAAVVALAGAGEARQLVGYVVGSADERTLRRALEARLPGYMVPGAFVRLEALPLMPNGKVDRAALPAPQAGEARERVAPRTVLEGELLAIWAAVLGHDALGVTDNFFEVGGHSLLLMQVASRIRQELGREVSLATLFQHPVVESLAAQLESGEVRAVEAIRRREAGSRIPLTWAQERLWFLWNLEPQSAAYTIAGAVRLRGALDVGAVRAALDQLVMRHESLRTRFVEEDGQAWQVVDEVNEASGYGWRMENLAGHSGSVALEAKVNALSREPFDLRAGPMLRVTLLGCGHEEWVLHLSMPHIVSDAWSQAILLREFSQLYTQAVSGDTDTTALPELAALPVQYGDYAQWQRRHLDAAALEAQYTYWEQELGGEQPLLELPVDRVRQGAAGSAGAWVERRVEASLAQALERVSHAAGATRFMTLLAAFGVMLGRYSGQDDIRIGMPVAGRERLETEPLIGFFVNTLVARVTPRGTQPFGEVLAQVKERVLGAHAHSQVPFAKLVERLQPQRSVSHTPLFQAMFDYSAEEGAPVGLPGIEVSTLEGGTGTTQFDLSMQVSGSTEDGGLRIALNYATDILDEGTVQRLLDSYVRVLEQVAAQPDVRIAQIGLQATERAPRELEHYTFVPVAQRIAQQAVQTPQAMAIRCGQQTLSYAQLDRWSDHIAGELQARGVGAEQCVGVCVSRSVGMVAALLGVMKAGAAYLPLDPAFPAERLAYMLEDAQAGCVVTDAACVAQLGEVLDGCERVMLDLADAQGEATRNEAAGHEAAGHEATRRKASPVRVHPAQLAYVIYTSGSTGRPKGVGVPHEALDRFLASMKGRPGINEDDVWLSVTTLSFDIAALELYLPLISGARIELAAREDVVDGERFATLLAQSGATILQATPMGWKVLLEGGWQGQAEGRPLKGLCGGEALPRELALRLQARGVALWNMYGPTETTVWSSVCHPEDIARGTGMSVELGEAIEGTPLRLIDRSGAAVPHGGIGELCIGGTNLARGYRGRAALSAERFVPDPFDVSGKGGRLYRTGDLCRIDGAGRLVYVGRADQQVKLHGFRIELGEIEAVLGRSAQVRDAAVALRTVAGQTLLVGYVVPAAVPLNPQDTAIEEALLRAQMAQSLPSYMVPQRIVTLAALPLTHNGKLDRNALPLPDAGSDTAHHVEPHTPTERTLAAIWQQVLGVQRVSAHDDFFALGGQSLLVLRAMAHLRDQLKVALPLQILFAHPVLSELAQAVDRLVVDAQSATVPASGPMVARTPGSTSTPLSPAQERLWFFSRLDPLSPAYNLSGAVKLDGALDQHALRDALAVVVARHESLRTRFVEHDGVAHQQIDVTDYGWSVLDFEDIAQDDVDVRLTDTLRALSRMPFSLEDGPLLRVTLIRLGTGRHVLHFVTHHIVSDAWSIKIMIDEFARAYAAICKGHPVGLAALPVQYGDYALWQRDPLQQSALASELAFWRMRLGNEHSALELPFDRAPGVQRSQAGGRISIELAPGVIENVRALCRAHQATPFMVLLAAFNLLLERYSGQHDIRIGVPVAGREHIETQALIGFFVNTLVIRTEMQGLRTVDALLEHVRERVLEAQAHQHVPFTSVVDALAPERSLTQTPLFNVMFNFDQAFDDQTFELPGLRLSPIETSTGTARFDLVLWAREKADGFEVSFTYARDVLDGSTVSRMLDHYVSLLEQVGARGEVHLGELVLEEETPRAALAAHGFEPVGERIVTRALQQPQAPAVHCEGARLDYGELQTWSGRLAQALRTRGVSAETRVGLCVTRGPGLVAALVGVLRSGGAFVPLDPAYPAERLATMLDDAQVGCVLADATTLASCGELFTGREVIDIGTVSTVAEDGTLPEIVIHPEQLAYVIYTSGSTGRPKGVAVSHVALSRHLDDFIGTYGISHADTQLQSSTVNFDVALHELLPALVQGGQVEMRGPQLWDIETTSRHLKEGGVTFARIPTAYWQQWLRTPPARADLAALRQITVGGEALPGDALAQWQRGPLAHIQLDNLYGPTETTVACMYRRTDAADAQQTVVSIGGPYGSRCVYVLDRFGNEVPVGGLGELCIGGLTLARGYLARPGLSADRFVPDPNVPGARLYRSGDLCRRRADGSIDFLGRLDQQVKLRGFRIELGEIEAALRQVEGVSAAVVALAGAGEARQLVGYVVGSADERTLRRALEARLPGYMVPGAFVRLEALPLMPNGKVDRAALPAPQAGEARERVAPRTVLEGELLAIWAAVLGHDALGVTDNFFEVGGHSLLLMQVASRIRQELGREVSLATLFQHPVVESLAAQLESGEVRAVEAIRRREAGSRIPLTWAQERLWFLWNLEPQSAAYTIAGAVRLRGALDVGAVRAALDQLVMRHESLRTRFVEEDGQAWQVVDEVNEASGYGWRMENLAGHSGSVALEAKVNALSREPFDLRAGPMLRVTLLGCGHEEWVLHLSMPHIVSDAWSQAILLREFSQLYTQAVSGDTDTTALPELAALPVQYGDYAQWQRRHLDAAALEAQYTYWEQELGGEQPLLELPVDRVRQGAAGSAGAWVERRVEASLAQALERVSHAAGATRFMTLLAAFGVMLGRYSGQDDIRIGMPVAGRERLETEPLIGFFVNTLVARVTPRGTQPFGEVLAQVKERVLGAHAHSQVPFAKLVERLQPQRSVSHTPLFQAMFDYSAEEGAPVGLPGIEVSTLEGGTGTTQFDLSMQVSGSTEDGGLRIALNYATDILDEGTVQRLLDSYVRVLEQVAAQPDVRIAQIGLQATERAPRELEHYTFVPVAQRIAQQAVQTPQAMAIRCGQQTLSYAQLDRWSDHIAGELQARGVGAEQCVGVCVNRSVGMVAALLGVMKAGAAYLPLDPAFPAERLAYMLDDAQAGCVVTDAACVAQLGEVLDGCERVMLDLADAQGEATGNEATKHEAVSIHPAQLAYVIYTSGSTGRPKGVGVPHEALDRFLASMKGRPGINEDDVWLSVTTLSFDIAALELYLPLIAGARIELAAREDVVDGERFATLLEQSGATILQATPMGWKVLLEGGWQGQAEGRPLKGLCGGEALPRELALRLQARGVALWNMYGPTETTIWSSVCDPEDVARGTGMSVELGEAIEGTPLRLIDRSGAAVPHGGIGELCIGGTNLARGYRGRAALSAERFVPDPFDASGRGGRLYRTGDLCRFDGAGRLVYVGRADQQVKLHGFRIELGEIEAVLGRSAQVRDAAVALRTVAGQTLLVGYVVPLNPEDTAIGEAPLRAQMAQSLPSYMVPQRIVTLAALPLTHNGKLDRNALPLPDAGSDTAHHVEPHTPTERTLAAIWQQVLGVQRVSAHDDFFALGGDSLRTLQVARLAREAALRGFGIETLFARPRLSDLAAHIDTWAERLSSNIVPMNAPNAPTTVFALHPAYGLIAEYRTLARQLDGIATVYGVQSPLYSDPQWWARDLDALASDYAARVREVQPQGPYRLIGWSLGGLLALEVVAQLEAAGETVEFVGLIDAGMQDNVRHDATRAAELLAHRRTVTSEEVAAFWTDADAERQHWRTLLGDTADDPTTLGNVLLAIEQLKALTANWRTRQVKAPLTIWWAGRNVDAVHDAPRIDPRVLEEKTARWRACSSGETVLAGVIDTDHPGIVQHPMLFDSLAARLADRHNDAAVFTGSVNG